MPRKAKYAQIQSRFFKWRVMPSPHGVWYADGRSNQPNVGRHSLGTKDRNDALRLLHWLDSQAAVKHGLADRSILGPSQPASVSIVEGANAYLRHVGRPEVTGGASAGTVKRYKPVFAKFSGFLEGRDVGVWSAVTRRTLEEYATHLEDQGYQYRTEYLELTTIKQAMKWMVEEGMLPQQCLIKLPLTKPNGSPTYCYERHEVGTIIQLCRENPNLSWLGDVVRALAYTGMRVSELAQLDWADVDLQDRVLFVRDASRGAGEVNGSDLRRTKSRKSRVVPIQQDLFRRFIAMNPQAAGRVFLGPRRGRLKPDTVRSIFVREVLPIVATQLYPKVPNPDVLRGRIHSFRHTFCTLAYRAGWAERTILDVMGHSSSNITRLYRHIGRNDFKKAVEAFPSVEYCVANEQSTGAN